MPALRDMTTSGSVVLLARGPCRDPGGVPRRCARATCGPASASRHWRQANTMLPRFYARGGPRVRPRRGAPASCGPAGLGAPSGTPHAWHHTHAATLRCRLGWGHRRTHGTAWAPPRTAAPLARRARGGPWGRVAEARRKRDVWLCPRLATRSAARAPHAVACTSCGGLRGGLGAAHAQRVALPARRGIDAMRIPYSLGSTRAAALGGGLGAAHPHPEILQARGHQVDRHTPGSTRMRPPVGAA